MKKFVAISVSLLILGAVGYYSLSNIQTSVNLKVHNSNKSHAKTFDEIFHCLDPRWQTCYETVVRGFEKTLSPEARAKFQQTFQHEFDQFENDEKAYEKAHGGQIQTPAEWKEWLEKKGFLKGESKAIWACYDEAYVKCHGPAVVETVVAKPVVKFSHSKTFDQIFHCLDPRWQTCYETVVRGFEKTLSPEARAKFQETFQHEFDQFENDEKAYEKAHGGQIQTPAEWKEWLEKKGFLKGESKAIWACYDEAYVKCHGPAVAVAVIAKPVIQFTHSKTFDQIFHCLDPRWQTCYETVVRGFEKTLSPEARAKFEQTFQHEFDQFENDEKAYEKAHGGQIQTPAEWKEWLEKKGFLKGDTKDIWTCYDNAYTTCHGPALEHLKIKLPPGYFDCIGQEVPTCKEPVKKYIASLKTDDEKDQIREQFQEQLDQVWTQMENIYDRKQRMACPQELQDYINLQGYNIGAPGKYWKCWLPAYNSCALNPKC